MKRYVAEEPVLKGYYLFIRESIFSLVHWFLILLLYQLARLVFADILVDQSFNTLPVLFLPNFTELKRQICG